MWFHNDHRHQTYTVAYLMLSHIAPATCLFFPIHRRYLHTTWVDSRIVLSQFFFAHIVEKTNHYSVTEWRVFELAIRLYFYIESVVPLYIMNRQHIINLCCKSIFALVCVKFFRISCVGSATLSTVSTAILDNISDDISLVALLLPFSSAVLLPICLPFWLLLIWLIAFRAIGSR